MGLPLPEAEAEGAALDDERADADVAPAADAEGAALADGVGGAGEVSVGLSLLLQPRTDEAKNAATTK